MATATKSKSTVPFHSSVDLSDDAKAQLIKHLNQMLADAFDLYSQVKQAHWNVKGKDFIQFHELFDEVAAELIPFVDDLAERAVTLGGVAHGTARQAAESSRLAEYPDLVDGLDHVRAVVERVAHFANALRQGIDTAGDLGDQNTADLYTEIGRAVDKRLWFLEAHLQGEHE